MKKTQRIGAIVALGTAALGLAAFSAAGPASAAPHFDRGIVPVSTSLRAVEANTTTATNIFWRTDSTICHASVQVVGSRQLDVNYARNQRSTTFSHGNMLRRGATDFTTVWVTPHYDRSGVAVLRATVS